MALIAPAPATGRIPSQALESLREGWRFLRRQPVILGTFVIDTNAMVFGMPEALFPAIAVHHFDAGARVVGVLYAAPSAGALLAALTSGWTGRLRRQGVGVAVAIVVWGVAIAVFGLATALWLAVAMLALAGLADEYSRSPAPLSCLPRRPTRCAAGCKASSWRRWRARPRSATWRPASWRP